MSGEVRSTEASRRSLDAERASALYSCVHDEASGTVARVSPFCVSIRERERGVDIARGRGKRRPEAPRVQRQRSNEEITAPRVRVVDENGEQLGVLPLRDALNAARERGLDLVEVAPQADPPVCRILDFGKWYYEQTKKQREAQRAQKTVEIKEIRLRPKTSDHHAGFKLKRARNFLEKGMKVKVRIQFRGREITHPEIALEQLKEVAALLEDIAEVEQHPNMEGRSLLMVLAPR